MDVSIATSITEEIRLLGTSFLLGIALMIFYDLIRLSRALIPQGFWAVAVEDMVFWIISSLAIFILLFVFNEGKIRFYALLAVGLGMLGYYTLIGRRWPPLLHRRIKKHREVAQARKEQKEKKEKPHKNRKKAEKSPDNFRKEVAKKED